MPRWLGGGGVAIPWEYGPLQPGNIFVPNPSRYRCAYCAGANECRLECAKDVERAILAEGPETVAAFIGSLAAGRIIGAMSVFSIVSYDPLEPT